MPKVSNRKYNIDMNTLNILVSSTRQWNPGDEFILFGVQNLLNKVLRGEINWTLYDRNPDRWINDWKLPLLKSTNLSNVFRHYTLEGFDIAVIAGTIEWYGEPLKRFYSLIREYNVPLLICGAGYNFGSSKSQFDTETEEATIDFSDDEIYCLRHLAQMVTVRDRYVSNALSKVGIPHHLLPCPALFAATQENMSNEIRRIAFILQSVRGKQSIPEQLVNDALTAISELHGKGLEVEVICHYIDEFIDFLPFLSPIRYSYDAREYLGLLNSFDVIVSTRLHGAILGNSLGKPTILINTEDMRCKIGAEPFPFIYVAHAKDVKTILERINVGEVSKQLIDWKLQIKKSYLKLLKPASKKLSQQFNGDAASNAEQTVSYMARPSSKKSQPELSHAQLKENFSSSIELLKSKKSQIHTNHPIFEQEREELELTLQVYGAQISELNNMVQAKAAQINNLEASLQEKVSDIADLEISFQEKDAHIDNLETSLQESFSLIANLETSLQEMASRVSYIAELEASLQEKVSHIDNLETSLQEKVSDIANLETSLQETISDIADLKISLQEKDAHIDNLETSLQDRISQIQQIQRSIPMQLVNRYQRVVEKLLRRDTRRRHYYELALTGIRVILNEGWRSFWYKFRQRYRRKHD